MASKHQSSVTVTKASLILKTLPEKNGKQNGGAEMGAIEQDPIERAFRWIETAYDVRHMHSYGSQRDAKPDLMQLGNEFCTMRKENKALKDKTDALVKALEFSQSCFAALAMDAPDDFQIVMKMNSEALAKYKETT